MLAHLKEQVLAARVGTAFRGGRGHGKKFEKSGPTGAGEAGEASWTRCEAGGGLLGRGGEAARDTAEESREGHTLGLKSDSHGLAYFPRPPCTHQCLGSSRVVSFVTLGRRSCFYS